MPVLVTCLTLALAVLALLPAFRLPVRATLRPERTRLRRSVAISGAPECP